MDTKNSFANICLVFVFLALFTGCKRNTSQPEDVATAGQVGKPGVDVQYSNFGTYQPFPEWSGWCPVSDDPGACKKDLQSAVTHQTANSREVVRGHGWGLWAAIATPIDHSGYDKQSNSSNLFGTSDCWLKRADGTACSGVFPIWLTWPNTGLPYGAKTEGAQDNNNLIAINKAFSEGSDSSPQLDTTESSTAAYVNPTLVSTVNTTTKNAPNYVLPALAVTKSCGIEQSKAQQLIDKAIASSDWQPLQKACEHNGHMGVVCAANAGFCDGSAFVNQGDVMIATESLSSQTWDVIQTNGLYGTGNTLNNIYKANNPNKASKQVANWLPPEYVSTKHMFWPVKGCNPTAKQGGVGCRIRYGALPPWVPSRFKALNYATDSTYLGYETWGEVVAIDTCGETCTGADSATLALAYVENANAITTKSPKVYPASAFVHLQLSAETLENALTPTDRALLDQATIWAYGDQSNGFEAGDFLVVVAMHITTKEVDTWAFNSVWWSPMGDTLQDCPLDNVKSCFGQSPAYGALSKYSGLTQADTKKIDARVGTQWRDNYLLTDSYGIRYELNGKPATAASYFATPPRWSKERPDGTVVGQLPVSMNVYIEPVIHPLGSNCQNCHRRAGIMSGSAKKSYVIGAGLANYQTAQCPSLLADYGSPATDPCLTQPWIKNDGAWLRKGNNHCKPNPTTGVLCDGNNAYPIVNTDTSWFIADRHIQKAAN